MSSINHRSFRESKENSRRKFLFLRPKPRHVHALICGGILASVLVHFLGYSFLNWIGFGIPVSSISEQPSEKNDPGKTIILHSKQNQIETPPPDNSPDDITEVEPTTDTEIDTPPLPTDAEDEVSNTTVMKPGSTIISTSEPTASKPDDILKPGEIPNEKILRGIPEPPAPDPITSGGTIPLPEPGLGENGTTPFPSGNGGDSNSDLPTGSKSLSDILNIPNPGKDSGFCSLGADLLFEYNQAVLKSGARKDLILLNALMTKNPDTVFIVEGHTDNFGSDEYNAVLSLMRANAVREWVKDHGMKLTDSKGKCRFYILACGASAPIKVDGDKNAQSVNRRVEIHMRRPGEYLPSGCLPLDYQVDMASPISLQIQQGVGKRLFKDGSPRPFAHTAQRSSETIKTIGSSEMIRKAEPVESTIPDAEPIY